MTAQPTLSSINAEASTVCSVEASQKQVQEQVFVTLSQHSTESVPVSIDPRLTAHEAARLARGLSPLQNWIVRQAVAAGGVWTSTPEFQALDGGGLAIVSLRRQCLLRAAPDGQDVLTAAGRQVAGRLPALDQRVRGDGRYLRILQNLHLDELKDADGWLLRERAPNGVRGKGKDGHGILQTLVVMGYLEVNARWTHVRLTAAGRLFRRFVFTPEEYDALAYFGAISLRNPEVYIPRPASSVTRIAPRVTLSRPRRIGAGVVKALVARGLLEPVGGGVDAYRATALTRRLVAPAPVASAAAATAYAVGGEYVRQCLEKEARA